MRITRRKNAIKFHAVTFFQFSFQRRVEGQGCLTLTTAVLVNWPFLCRVDLTLNAGSRAIFMRLMCIIHLKVESPVYQNR